jgi:hypothetical protein
MILVLHQIRMIILKAKYLFEVNLLVLNCFL